MRFANSIKEYFSQVSSDPKKRKIIKNPNKPWRITNKKISIFFPRKPPKCIYWGVFFFLHIKVDILGGFIITAIKLHVRFIAVFPKWPDRRRIELERAYFRSYDCIHDGKVDNLAIKSRCSEKVRRTSDFAFLLMLIMCMGLFEVVWIVFRSYLFVYVF